MQDENYIVIQGWMRNRLQLKGQQLLVYALIYGFSQDGNQKFTGSLSYIIEAVGGSKPTVKKALNELVENELLIKEEEYKNNVKFVTYYARNFTRGGKETFTVGMKETLPNNTNNNNIKDNINKNIIKENETQKIFDYWNKQEIIKHRKLNADIKKAIEKAIKKYSFSEVSWAISHYSEVLKSDYFFQYHWSLIDFLNRKNGISTFMDEGSNWNGYLKWKEEQKPKLATHMECDADIYK